MRKLALYYFDNLVQATLLKCRAMKVSIEKAREQSRVCILSPSVADFVINLKKCINNFGGHHFFSVLLIANPLIFFLNPLNASPLIFNIFKSAKR
jgi:hypothetical protein